MNEEEQLLYHIFTVKGENYTILMAKISSFRIYENLVEIIVYVDMTHNQYPDGVFGVFKTITIDDISIPAILPTLHEWQSSSKRIEKKDLPEKTKHAILLHNM